MASTDPRHGESETASSKRVDALIVGSGFSGIGAAVALQRVGLHDFVILERDARIGGTWAHHDYPGLEVDMPFFIYSFPFEMKADWSRLYPSGAEMRAYTHHCIEKYDLARRTRCGVAVARAEYDGERNLWQVQAEDGESWSARYLVNATGLLVLPRRPDIPGLSTFAGETIHSSEWNHAFEPEGKRIAVIGTGATAIQVIPEIAPRAERVDVYQRTPIWLLPKPNPKLSPRAQAVLEAVPATQVLARWLTNLFVEIVMGAGLVRYSRFPWIFDWIERKAADFVRREIDDPEVAEKLIPDYSFFCKRPSFSNTLYPTLNRENVALLTDPILRATPRGIVTRDDAGHETEHPADAIICATGYNVFNRSCTPGYALIGATGEDLGARWERDRYRAYEGATVPDFPNLFLMMGPHSAAGASYFTMIDTQSHHMARCIREARRRGSHYVEVRQSAFRPGRGQGRPAPRVDGSLRRSLRHREQLLLRRTRRHAGSAPRHRLRALAEQPDLLASGLRLRSPARRRDLDDPHTRCVAGRGGGI